MNSQTASAPLHDLSFQGTLAEVAFPGKKFPPARDNDGLLPDTATFSQRFDPGVQFQEQRVMEPDRNRFNTRLTVQEADPRPFVSAAPLENESLTADAASADPRRRCASVTLRLTEQENARLRQMSAEAGFTVSAYLRFCALEVERLRAEVKATVAQLQGAAATHPPKEKKGKLAAVWFRRWRRWRASGVRHSTLG